MAWSTEEGYDHVIVEAHTSAQDDWTTLPDLNGNTTTDVPRNARRLLHRAAPEPPQVPDARRPVRRRRSHGLVELLHRRLRRLGAGRVRPLGLRRPAGRDRRQLRDRPGHRRAGRHPRRHPAGHHRAASSRPRASRRASGPGRCSARRRAQPTTRSTGSGPRQLGDITAGVATEDTLLLGFGIEQLESPEARAELVADALELLGVSPPGVASAARTSRRAADGSRNASARSASAGTSSTAARSERAVANGEDRLLLRPRERPHAGEEAIVEDRAVDRWVDHDRRVGRSSGCGRRVTARRCRTRAGGARVQACRDRATGRRARRTARVRARPGTCAAAVAADRAPRGSPSAATTLRRRPVSLVRRRRGSAARRRRWTGWRRAAGRAMPRRWS